MDNILDQTPAAPSQGQPQPESAQVPSNDASGNTPTSGATVDTTQPGAEPTQQFEMPDKFRGKSAEEIAKSYVDLESHNKKVEMERADLEKIFVPQEKNDTTPTAPQPVVPESEDPMKALVKELNPLLQEELSKIVSPLAARFEVRDMADKYSDFSQLAQQVKQVKEQNPSLSLETAYKIAKFDAQQELQRTAYNQGVSEAQQKDQLAQKAQVESSRPSGIRPQSLEQAIGDKNVPTEEIMEALGPEFDSFKRGYENKRAQLETFRRFAGKQ